MEFAMTNEELAAAISYAFDRCDQKYVGGYTTRETDSGKEMLVHLRALLAVQLERAKLEVTPNCNVTGAEPAGGASGGRRS